MENKKRYFKFIAGFFGIIAGVFILSNIALWGWQKYDLWQGQKAVQKLAEGLKKIEQENYQRAMADIYGGKTPQETLWMYIDAVKNEDFELASKYFRDPYRDEQKRILNSINQNNKISFLIKGLESAIPVDEEKEYRESYKLNKDIINSSEEEWINNLKELNKNFYRTMGNNQGYIFFISFIQYPNNVWKIKDEIEIKNISSNYYLKF